jgi:hypothetical protein
MSSQGIAACGEWATLKFSPLEMVIKSMPLWGREETQTSPAKEEAKEAIQ